MKKILIVEDDEVVYGELSRIFTHEGCKVIDGRAGIKDAEFDLAVLDIGLPGESGYEICSRLREKSDAPIIFLTSNSTAESELMGFAVGADDFIRKPFSPPVLLARVRRLLKISTKEKITVGRLTLDTIKLEAVAEGNSVVLTKTEFTVLKLLSEGKPVPAMELVERLWDAQTYADVNTLYVYIKRLREKLETIGLNDAIKNMRGRGYTLEAGQ